MKLLISIFLTLNIFILFSCNENSHTNLVTNDKAKPPIQSVEAITIEIQPFEDLPDSYLTYVEMELKKIYDRVEVKPRIELPKKAFNKRLRYRADTIIEYLSQITINHHLKMGLTSKDISCTNGKYPDWGVMGLGYCPGKSCVASSFRLDKTKVKEQLFKVAIHELGHTQGLPHCPVKTCFMRDAKGKNNTDEEKEFCVKCKAVLVKAGWNLK